MRMSLLRFIQPIEIPQASFGRRLYRMNTDGVYSNNGAMVRELERRISLACEAPVATACNATVALQVLKAMYHRAGRPFLLPSFTFPATNVNTPGSIEFAEPHTDGVMIGRVDPSEERVVQLVTVPFGDPRLGLAHYCAAPTIVDAAACATPDMLVVREWLARRAEAVVVSLHATKLWPAGEGAFVAFASEERREQFVRACNFGIAERGDIRTAADWSATNGKMSEVCAAAALSTQEAFTAVYHVRAARAARMAQICEAAGVDYVPGLQTFWIAPRISWRVSKAVFADVETKNYYWTTPVTPHTELCYRGLCLPMHSDKIVHRLESALGIITQKIQQGEQ
jgi:dTDP-4-amino-4,6-dideoxygalactose transaminase